MATFAKATFAVRGAAVANRPAPRSVCTTAIALPARQQTYRQPTASPCAPVLRPVTVRHRQAIIAQSSTEVALPNEAEGAPGAQYTPVFALAFFAAAYFNQVNINWTFLLKAFAWFSLAISAADLTFEQGSLDRVGHVVGPAVLATNILNLFDPATVTTALIGWYLARDLKGSVPFWGWLATLGLALYTGYGLHWVTVAYAYGSLTRFLDGLEESKAPIISVPILAMSVFAIAKEYKSLWVVSLALGEVARSFVYLVQNLKDEKPKGLTEKQ